jgi:hypothetical protein
MIAEFGSVMKHHGTASSIALCNIAHYAGNLELALFADLMSVKSLDFCLGYRALGGMSVSARGFESNRTCSTRNTSPRCSSHDT